ncbi:MAG: hypothetical protein WCF67_05445 [Chitinophagaceae bacterium]
MNPFAIGIEVERKYVELLIQEFKVNNGLHYQCTAGTSIVFWIEKDQQGSWRQLDGTINPLTSIIGSKIDQYKDKHPLSKPV